MTTAITFSRQNDAGSRVSNIQYCTRSLPCLRIESSLSFRWETSGVVVKWSAVFSG